MTEPKPVFVVWGTYGEYSDAQFKIFCATTDREEADDFARKGNEEGDRKATGDARKRGKTARMELYRSNYWTYYVKTTYGPNVLVVRPT